MWVRTKRNEVRPGKVSIMPISVQIAMFNKPYAYSICTRHNAVSILSSRSSHVWPWGKWDYHTQIFPNPRLNSFARCCYYCSVEFFVLTLFFYHSVVIEKVRGLTQGQLEEGEV